MLHNHNGNTTVYIRTVIMLMTEMFSFLGGFFIPPSPYLQCAHVSNHNKMKIYTMEFSHSKNTTDRQRQQIV